MRVAVTGTPGTGKTTAVDFVDTDLDVVHLNELVRDRGLDEGTDEKRGSLVADVEALEAWFEEREDVVVESHFSHYLPVDSVVVLRCHPDLLEHRLAGRGAGNDKISENAEAEALDIILSEAVERHGKETVYEVDTSDMSPAAIAMEIEAVIAGNRNPSAGTVDFLEYL